MRRRLLSLPRSLAWLSVAASLLLVSGPSDAQKKKARRKKTPAAAPAAPSTAKPPVDQPTRATSAPAAPAAPAGKTTVSENESVATTTEEGASVAATGTPTATPFPFVEVSVGVRGFQRHLSYSDDVNGVMPSYDLGGAPAGRVGFAVYPLRTPKFSVGLVGLFEYAFALGSTFKKPPMGETEGQTYKTSSMQYAVGLRGNLLLGTSTLFAGIDYIRQSFLVNLPDPIPTNGSVPDVSYGALRPNVGVRVPLGEKFAVLGGIGYLLVLSAGEIKSSTYFPRSTVGGFDLNLGVSYALTPHIEIRPVVDYRHYFYSFHPQMGDPYIAGGATDRYIGASVSGAYLF